MNHRRSSSNVSTISPRVAFTGRKPNYNKELGLAFGDYVERYDPKVKSNDAEDDRAEPCIALYPTGNAVGSWNFLNVTSGRQVRRSNWTKMVTTELVINAVNAMADHQDGIRTAPTVADAAVQSEDAVDDVPLGHDDEVDVPRHDVGDQALIDQVARDLDLQPNTEQDEDSSSYEEEDNTADVPSRPVANARVAAPPAV
jgi:hypothetical protein